MIDEQSHRFHLEEFKALRAEIDQRIASVRVLEREIALGSFAIYGWLATQAPSGKLGFLSAIVSWLPVALAVVGHWRRNDEAQQINRIAEYLTGVEKKLADPGLKGWETHWAPTKQSMIEAKDKTDISNRYWGTIARRYIWFTVIVSTIFTFTILVGQFLPNQK